MNQKEDALSGQLQIKSQNERRKLKTLARVNSNDCGCVAYLEGQIVIVNVTTLTWNEAREHCISELNGDLMRIKTRNANVFLDAIIAFAGYTFLNYYVGLTAQGYDVVRWSFLRPSCCRCSIFLLRLAASVYKVAAHCASLAMFSLAYFVRRYIQYRAVTYVQSTRARTICKSWL